MPTAVKDYEGTKKAIDKALDRFSLEYIDMLLIHSPQPWIEVNRTNDRHFEGNLENWRAMEEAVKAGKVRSIGVSNFLQEDVLTLLIMVRLSQLLTRSKFILDMCQQI